ncbi:MAG: NAD(P)/FAD-dependent oxidoreductase [Firmicutes bacterium]|nr:NAD(P)/FAD-dependent oxidoreductase [Bacillota bacterium]
MATAAETTPKTDFDAIVVGAGFSGMYMLYRLRDLGFSVRVFEAGDGVGGTWYWNRYPGARCDSESYYYCYSFSKELLDEWEWSERYPAQPEVLQYLNHVADRFHLRPDIQLNTRVVSAVFDDASGRWKVTTDDGKRYTATYFITAVGCLSTANLPHYEGLEEFQGTWYHTGQWRHEPVVFTGQRVGLIGTGASGIQATPEIAKQAAHLYVFQRTPNYATPSGNRPMRPEEIREIKAHYDEIWKKARESMGGFPFDSIEKSALEVSPEERRRIYEERWQQGSFRFLNSFSDLLVNKEANDTIAQFVRDKIHEIVKDPKVADLLSPTNHPYGTKRPPLNTGYYETFNRENVTLVDIRNAPIVRITPTGIQTTENTYELDSIVFATGFDAMTGTLLKIDIRGRNELTLKEKWADGPRTYLGLAIHGFPNMFTITGPGSPSVLSNMPVSIEQHVDWIADCLAYLRAQGIARIEATQHAEEIWVAHVNQVADQTLFPLANSWYIGANIPGKPRVFMPYVGGVGNYRKICDAVAAKHYEGFEMAQAIAI